MEIYSYSPKTSDGKDRLLVFLILALGVAAVIAGGFLPAYRGIVQMLGFVVLILGVMLCARYMLTSYTYVIEEADNEGFHDFVVKETKGGRMRTVCRVRIEGSTLKRGSRASSRATGASYDYRASLFGDGCYCLSVSERDGGGSVRFSPDEKTVELLYSLGAKKE